MLISLRGPTRRSEKGGPSGPSLPPPSAERAPRRSFEPPPPPAPSGGLLALVAPAPTIDLVVPGFLDAVLAVPVGAARAEGPVPSRDARQLRQPCLDLRDLPPGRGRTAVRPPARAASPRRDTRPPDVRFEYAGQRRARARDRRGVHGARGALPDHVDAAAPIYAGFSQGAIGGVAIALRAPKRFARLALVRRAAPISSPTRPRRAFAKGGGERVLFACGSPWCTPAARRAAARLERAGVAAKVVIGEGVGHGYDGAVAERLRENTSPGAAGGATGVVTARASATLCKDRGSMALGRVQAALAVALAVCAHGSRVARADLPPIAAGRVSEAEPFGGRRRAPRRPRGVHDGQDDAGRPRPEGGRMVPAHRQRVRAVRRARPWRRRQPRGRPRGRVRLHRARRPYPRQEFDYETGHHRYAGQPNAVLKKFDDDLARANATYAKGLERVARFGSNTWTAAALAREGSLYDSCRTTASTTPRRRSRSDVDARGPEFGDCAGARAAGTTRRMSETSGSAWAGKRRGTRSSRSRTHP